MMISIFAPTELHGSIQNIIATEDRLGELVSVKDILATPFPEAANTILVNEKGIQLLPDWYNQLPPILYPVNIDFDSNTILGLVFARLGNYEKAYGYLSGYPALLFCTDIINRLQQQVIFTNDIAEQLQQSGPADAHALHNLAVCYHYAEWQTPVGFETIANQYEQAIIQNTDPSVNAFTIKQYATLLADSGQLGEAEAVLKKALDTAIPQDAKFGLQAVLASVWMNRMQVPYDMELLEILKAMLWDNLQYLEQTNRKIEEALLLIDAAHIANISNSFSESLGYISKAIQILQDQQQPELAANAQLKKGILLYTWAQNGQPQFYKGAMDALLAALNVFKREIAPDVFADIHHYLGIIYAEIPDEIKKKGIWAAVSVSSFTEALNFYNKVDYPYEFAMICHHQGNAYTKYPAALHSDNFDKALAWYREALDIRTADKYPIERSNTLFNYLEASWAAANPDENFNEERYNDMWQKATELQQLATDAALREEANAHIQQLEAVKMQFFPAQVNG
jgi:hypothetical protein